MNDKIKLFNRFLKENNCYKQYHNNLINHILYDNYKFNNVYDIVNELTKEKYKESNENEISLAFCWAKTKQGFNYWLKIFHKWKENINHE